MSVSILVVDDEPDVADLFPQHFRREARQGTYVLHFAASGEEALDQLFQPFFTTKPTGEGTGLGLSISWDIVTQQHGGSIEVDSEPGEFTEFTIRLPRAASAEEARR